MLDKIKGDSRDITTCCLRWVVGCCSDVGCSSGCHQSGGEDGRGVKQRRKFLWSGYHLQGVCLRKRWFYYTVYHN